MQRSLPGSPGRLWLLAALSLTILVILSATAFAQGPQARITQQIDNRVYVPLPGNVRPEAASAKNIRGPVANDLNVDHIFLFLQRSPQTPFFSFPLLASPF